MAQPHQRGDDGDGEQGTPQGRRRARILIPLGLLLVAGLLIAYMVIVSLATTEDDEEILENEGAAPVVVLAVPAPLRG